MSSRTAHGSPGTVLAARLTPRTALTVPALLAVMAVTMGACAPDLPELTAIPDVGALGVDIDSFDDCAAAGFPVMESYPRQCRTPDGRTFTEDIGNELELADQIRIDAPRPGQVIASPLAISGQARGPWFFEADFPIVLVDDAGDVVATAIATAADEWMTEEFVAFTATLEFATPQGARGSLILEKDNPSGLPQHDAALIVPIRFAP